MKKSMILAAVMAALGLVGALRAAQQPVPVQAASCCGSGNACCDGGSGCCGASR